MLTEHLCVCVCVYCSYEEVVVVSDLWLNFCKGVRVLF